ncbi:MAG: hypothetical protein QM674_16860 [Burkholderiaceae bacterium]
MTKCYSSDPGALLTRDAAPRRAGWRAKAGALFVPALWIVGALMLVYFYRMSSGGVEAAEHADNLLCMVVDEILNVIGPSLTLDNSPG